MENIKPGDTLHTLTGKSLEVVDPGVFNGYVRARGVFGGADWYALSEIRERPPLPFLAQAQQPSVSIQPPADVSWNEAVLTLAAEFDRPVEFRYQKPSQDSEFRHIEPVRVFVANNGATCVVGLDEDGEVKCFRLDRIQGSVSV